MGPVRENRGAATADPWFNLRVMGDADLNALYRFIVYLGPGGQSASAYVPPDQEPKPPYVTLPRAAQVVGSGRRRVALSELQMRRHRVALAGDVDRVSRAEDELIGECRLGARVTHRDRASELAAVPC